MVKGSNSDASLATSLHLVKINNPVMAKSPVEVATDDASQQPRFVPLRKCANIAGYSAVFLAGSSPSFVIKSSKAIPHVIGLQGLGVRGMSTFYTEGCDRGFIYADSDGIARVTQLPDANLDLGVSVKKIALGVDVTGIAHHPTSNTYTVSCLEKAPFELPRDDDYHKEWNSEPTAYPAVLSLPPTYKRSCLKLINPITWTVIHQLDLDAYETIHATETLHLEVNEETKERRMLITVGTGIARGEDLPTRGRIHVLDIVPVVPLPDRPETNKHLKGIAREDIPRGAVTAVCEVGTQGLMLVAHGQKCMVRGLKEDGSLLPVAFMDMNCHVSAVREVRGTGLCLMADAFKGVWFTGYTEEPYRMMLLGKSSSQLELVTADFLPHGGELDIVAMDADGDVHVFEFNPERKPFLSRVLSQTNQVSQTRNPSSDNSSCTRHPSPRTPTPRASPASSHAPSRPRPPSTPRPHHTSSSSRPHQDPSQRSRPCRSHSTAACRP